MTLPLARRLMGDFGTVVFVSSGSVSISRHDSAMGGLIAAELTGDESPWLRALAVQQLPEEAFGYTPVATGLEENIDHVVGLVNASPLDEHSPLPDCHALQERDRRRSRIARREPVVGEELLRKSGQPERITCPIRHCAECNKRNSACRCLTGDRRCLHVVCGWFLGIDDRDSPQRGAIPPSPGGTVL